MRPGWGGRGVHLCTEGSGPVCQRALLATLFSDKALVKGLTPVGHGCWGSGGRGGQQQQQYSSPPRLQEGHISAASSTPQAGQYNQHHLLYEGGRI